MTYLEEPRGEVYIGDDLYASFDGWSFILRAHRDGGDHFVALEPMVLASFFGFVRETNRLDLKPKD